MHLRPPAFSHGFTSFLWGFGLGAYVWLGLLAIGAPGATAFVLGVLAGIGIFFLVLLFGGDEFR